MDRRHFASWMPFGMHKKPGGHPAATATNIRTTTKKPLGRGASKSLLPRHFDDFVVESELAKQQQQLLEKQSSSDDEDDDDDDDDDLSSRSIWDDEFENHAIRPLIWDDSSYFRVLMETYGSVWPQVWKYCVLNMIWVLVVWYLKTHRQLDLTASPSAHGYMAPLLSFLLTGRVKRAVDNYQKKAQTLQAGVFCASRDLVAHACLLTANDDSHGAKQWRHDVTYAVLVLLRVVLAVLEYRIHTNPWQLPYMLQEVQDELWDTNHNHNTTTTTRTSDQKSDPLWLDDGKQPAVSRDKDSISNKKTSNEAWTTNNTKQPTEPAKEESTKKCVSFDPSTTVASSLSVDQNLPLKSILKSSSSPSTSTSKSSFPAPSSTGTRATPTPSAATTTTTTSATSRWGTLRQTLAHVPRQDRVEADDLMRAPMLLAWNVRREIMKQRDGTWFGQSSSKHASSSTTKTKTPWQHDCNEELKLLDCVGVILQSFSTLYTLIQTPIPFPVLQLAHTILIAWVFTLPLVLCHVSTWSDDSNAGYLNDTPLVPALLVFLCTYGFLGTSMVCQRINDPFADTTTDPSSFDCLGHTQLCMEDCYLFIYRQDGKKWAKALRKRLRTMSSLSSSTSMASSWSSSRTDKTTTKFD